MSQFVKQEQVRLEVGPQQLALAVADGDLGQLTLAMRAASSMWGGRRFPILAVSESGEVVESSSARVLLDVLDVTTVIDFSGKLAPAGYVRSEDQRQIPVVPAKPLQDPQQWSPSALVGHTHDALKQMRLVEAASEDPVAVAALGRLACREEVDSWASFGAAVCPVEDESFFDAQAGGSSVIDVTVHGIPTLMAEAPFATSMVVVYVIGDEATFEDLQVFWNARAMRPGEEGVALLLRCDQVRTHAEELAETVRRTAQSNPSLSLVSLSVSVEELRELRSVVGIPAHDDPKWTDQRFGKATIEPTASVNADPRQYWTGRRYVGAAADMTVALYEPTTTLTFDNPFTYANPFFGSPIEVRLRSPAFEVPRRPAIARLFLPEAAGWAGDALRVPQRLYRRFGFELHLPPPDEVLTAAVELPFTRSDKARQLRAVMEGDTGSLALYRDPVVIAVIEALTPTDSRQLKPVLDRLEEPDRDFIRAAAAALRDPRVRTLEELTSALKPAGTGVTAARAAAALGELVARGHVHRGLRADCTLCDTKGLRQLDDAPAVPTCLACGAPAAYAAGGRGEPALYYGLSPVMRLASANGGLPVLAAAAVLQEEGVHLVPGVNASVDGEDFEVDLLGWGGTTVLAGEVKRRASGFTDVARDVRSSAQFGADIHIAATLDTIDQPLRTRLEEAAAAEGVELRVLDAAALLT